MRYYFRTHKNLYEYTSPLFNTKLAENCFSLFNIHSGLNSKDVYNILQNKTMNIDKKNVNMLIENLLKYEDWKFHIYS